ncbi:hypothetical protein HAX54_016205 [Datura stramonium]|uniref:Uncharacterized protein n=1 Tax=Datura stramonium TaxID=4076 RepID=A0ABS8UIF5_DATST|nr:hypothetical protein [Datura stramonium]
MLPRGMCKVLLVLILATVVICSLFLRDRKNVQIPVATCGYYELLEARGNVNQCLAGSLGTYYLFKHHLFLQRQLSVRQNFSTWRPSIFTSKDGLEVSITLRYRINAKWINNELPKLNSQQEDFLESAMNNDDDMDVDI